MALVVAALHVKAEGVPVVALDIAGAEEGFPAADHVDAYVLRLQLFFMRFPMDIHCPPL